MERRRSIAGEAGVRGFEPKHVTAIIVAVVIAAAAAAIVIAALLLRDNSAAGPQVDPREIACVEAGGFWTGAWCSNGAGAPTAS
jgi:hypothetical protein